MRNHLLLSLGLSLTASLPAQGTEWVTNGSFTGTLAPWTLGGGYSVNPGLDTNWDTTGFGVSDSFGVQAGGQVTPAPYPPNWIEQQVFVIQGLTYEFRCDASGTRLNSTVGNADIGTIVVEVDNVEVARHAFGGWASPQIKRAQVCGRFVPTTTGNVTLRINTSRAYLTNSTTPRMNIDNVSLRDVIGPTYWIGGNRQLGSTVVHRVRGTASAAFATFAALGENPAGLPFPGVAGNLNLDPATTVTLQIGGLDTAGESNTNIQIPNDPLFLSNPIFYQAGMLDGSGFTLGYYSRTYASQ